MRYLFVFISFLCSAVLAQEDTLSTTYLEEVNIYGMPISKYSAGTTLEKLDKEAVTHLDQAIASSPSVYFKTYGSGQLSTIAFRGTSASHTAVLWNGMNINSPTLGQTDFSLLPVYLLDEINLQYGTSSSLYGSDAIGGSVLINAATPEFKKAFGASIHQDVASFGSYFTGVTLRFSNGRWDLRSKVMYRELENDFPYTSPAVGSRKIQNDASVRQSGFDQQIHYRISDHKLLSLDLMHTYNFREIQPVVLTNDSDEALSDDNTRVNMSYNGSHALLGELYLSAGYSYHKQVFNKNEPSESNQITALFNADKSIGSKLNLRYGASWNRYFTEITNHPNNLSEDRCDFFSSWNYVIALRWILSLNIRQSLYAGRFAPFAPSAGVEGRIHDGKKSIWSIRSQLSKGYRVPTLNDRYWNPGGNPELRSENAWHTEAGISFKNKNSKYQFQGNISGYKTWTSQWIIWLPTEAGYWAPENLQRVNVYGVETSIKVSWKVGNFSFQHKLNYSYTRSKNLKGLNDSDYASVNKQLPYVPYHISHFDSKVIIKSWSGEIRIDYTGLRHTTIDNDYYQALDPNVLTTFSFSRKFSLWQCSALIRASINNVFDLYYENLKNRAMPGRSYAATVILDFNHISNP